MNPFRKLSLYEVKKEKKRWGKRGKRGGLKYFRQYEVWTRVSILLADTDTDTNTEVWRYSIDASGMDAKPGYSANPYL